MRYILSSFFLIVVFQGNSQIDIDSLYTKISRDYVYHGEYKLLMENFQVYWNNDSTDAYFFYVDSNDIMNDYICLATLHKSYDSLGRKILDEGYNLEGVLFNWDFPPYETYEYIFLPEENLLQEALNFHCECDTVVRNVRAVLNKEYDENKKLIRIRTRMYTEDSLAALEFVLNPDSSLNTYEKVASYLFRVYSNERKIKILEEWHFDPNMKLVSDTYAIFSTDRVSTFPDVKHAGYELIIIDEKNFIRKFYNKRRELILEKEEFYGMRIRTY